MVGNETINYNQAVMNYEILYRTPSISSATTITWVTRGSNPESPQPYPPSHTWTAFGATTTYLIIAPKPVEVFQKIRGLKKSVKWMNEYKSKAIIYRFQEGSVFL